MSTVEAEQLLTREQLWTLMNISPRKLDMMVASREFPEPDLRIGRKPRWRLSTYHRWIETPQPARS